MAAGLVLVERSERWASVAADQIANLLITRVEAAGLCTLALAGGTTPQPVYQHLSRPPLARRIPWPAIEVFFGDERAVPGDHPDSNFRMAHETLLNRVPVRQERVHRMEADRTDLDAAARDYARLLPDVVDVLILGMGTDGHTASLFPCHPALRERRRVVSVAGGHPFGPRLTITAPVILGATEVVVLVTGEDKAEVLARVLEGPDDTHRLPAQLARGRRWIVDRSAAACLEDPPR